MRQRHKTQRKKERNMAVDDNNNDTIILFGRFRIDFFWCKRRCDHPVPYRMVSVNIEHTVLTSVVIPLMSVKQINLLCESYMVVQVVKPVVANQSSFSIGVVREIVHQDGQGEFSLNTLMLLLTLFFVVMFSSTSRLP